MQTYEDLDTLAGGLRNTIDYIVAHNLALRGEVADAMGVLRETMDMKCLNEPGRVELVAGRVILALTALASEGQPTQWLEAAIQGVNDRPQSEVNDLDPGSIEAHAPIIVSDEPQADPAEPEETDDDDALEVDEDEELLDGFDWSAYALALQAQLRAHGIEPIVEDALDYGVAIVDSLAAVGPPQRSAPPEFQKIDGLSEV